MSKSGKKNFVGTYVLGGVVAVLAAYTAWEYKHANEELDLVKGERVMFTLKREDIDHLLLTAKGETTELRREGDTWKMLKPVEDLAEGSAVEGYLFSLLTQKVKAFETDDESKKVKWADFGFEPPAASIQIGVKGSEQSATIGTKNAFDGAFYVRQKDELLLGDRAMSQLIERLPSSFRSRHLWREDDPDLQRVTIVDGKDKYSFVKGGGTWTMEPKPSYAIDKHRFEVWMNKVEDFLPNDFVKEGFDDADKKADLLDKPSATITIDYKKKDGKDAQWTLTLGQNTKDGEVYLYTNQRSTLYKTGHAAVDAIRVPASYFRENKSPFQFEVEKASEVRVTAAKSHYVFKKTDGAWKLASGPQNMVLDQEKLVQLFTNLRSLDVQEFIGKGVGISKEPQVEILDEKSQTVFALFLGDAYQGKASWLSDMPLRYAKTNLSPEVLGIEKRKLDMLLNTELVKPASAQSPAEKKK